MSSQINQFALYCFLDTNTLIHFPTFDEVDWPAVLNSERVCLVLATVVLRELDSLNNDRKNPWRQSRARMLLSKLKSYLSPIPGETAQVRRGVSVSHTPNEPQVDWGALGLDRDVNDDRLLATIIEFAKASPESQVVLMSNDISVILKAGARDIACLDPENVMERMEPDSREEVRIRELERQVQQMERNIPALNFGFWEDGQPTIKLPVAKKSGWPSDEELLAEILAKRAGAERFMLPSRLHGVKPADVEKFRVEHEEYLRNLESARKMERSKAFGFRCQLRFVLKNTGSVPANDVDITLRFPSESFVLSSADDNSRFKIGEVTIPEEPKPEWLRKNLTTELFHIARPPLPPVEPKPRGPLNAFAWDRRIIHYRHPKMRQQDEWNMPSLVAYLTPISQEGVQLEYDVRADNLPSPVNGRLNIVLTSRD